MYFQLFQEVGMFDTPWYTMVYIKLRHFLWRRVKSAAIREAWVPAMGKTPAMSRLLCFSISDTDSASWDNS